MLDELAAAASEGRRDDCASLSFELLYGRPADFQLRAACFPVRRYLDDFLRRHPEAAWVAELVADVPAWVERNGRALADEELEAGPGDAAFLRALDGLLLGWTYRNDAATATSSFVYAITAAIMARQAAVWQESDPEAVTLWREGRGVAGRSATDVEPAVDAGKREWLALAEWLRQHDPALGDRVADDPERARALDRWRDAEWSLMPPRD
jgi:hypothetical protein